MATKNKFINVELDWAESRLESWKNFIDNNPYEDFIDRVVWKETKSGGAMPMVAATKEAQQKNYRDTMKDYLALLEVVDRLRMAEAKKSIGTRGDIEIPDIMKD